MSYQVFARKYRPRTFTDVLGQDHVVRTLRNAIEQNRLAHAYLFVGPRGTGKTSTARIFAKALNCPGGPKVDFDPDDPICLEIERGVSLDVREIDGASNNGVEQVRELREEVKFAPSQSRFKIYYIDEVHMLSTAAFNALLKTLEEPPEHVKFIFATTEAHKVLPTIISRCQRFDLKRIPANLIAEHLLHIASQEGIYLDSKAAYLIAKGADGGMRDAQSMLDQLVAFCGERVEEQDVLDVFGFTRAESVANLAVHVIKRDTVAALKELHHQADGGKDLSRFLADLIQHFRTLLVHQVDPAAAEEDLSQELCEMVRAQAAAVEAERILRVMDGLAEVDARMKWANNKLLHLEIGVIQAIQSLGEVTLSEVIAAVHGLDVNAAAPVEFVRKISPKVESLQPIAISEKPVRKDMPPVVVAPPVEGKQVIVDSIPPQPEEPVAHQDVLTSVAAALPPEVVAPPIVEQETLSQEEQSEVSSTVKIQTSETIQELSAPDEVFEELSNEGSQPVAASEPVEEVLETETTPPFDLGNDLFIASEPPQAPEKAKKATAKVKVAPQESLFGEFFGLDLPLAESNEANESDLDLSLDATESVEEAEPSLLPLEPETELVEAIEPAVEKVEEAKPDFWTAFVDRVGAERPLISSWVEIGQLVSLEQDLVTFALPEAEADGRDSLLRPQTKKFIEAVASEILGRSARIEIVLDPHLASPEPEASLDGISHSNEEVQATAVSEDSTSSASEPVMMSEEEFHSDPLIKAALEKFKATIVS